ncbi:hypothetical protein D9M71_514400 [compost metagenome]
MIVGAALGALQVVYRVEQDVELAGAFHGGEMARVVAGKSAEADRIPLAQCDVAQQQAGIERVIEMR